MAFSRRKDSHRLWAAFSIFLLARGADASYGPAPWQPDAIEDDYYRFLNSPRD